MDVARNVYGFTVWAFPPSCPVCEQIFNQNLTHVKNMI